MLLYPLLLLEWSRRFKPHCINPLTVVARMVEGQLKKRLSIDLSRHVNPLLKQEAMTMTMLEKSLQLAMPGDWMATYDLMSAFHHCYVLISLILIRTWSLK